MVTAAKIKEHWDAMANESLDDKHWLAAEQRIIAHYIPEGSRILEAGCGEGESTEAYAKIPGAHIVAVDYSVTRLNMARIRLQSDPPGHPNVHFECMDLSRVVPEGEFDVVVSQRFLINLTSWQEQREAIQRLWGTLRSGGRLILMEGSVEGQAELNDVRHQFGLELIVPKWHNLFIDDLTLERFMESFDPRGAKLLKCSGLGAFFLLTRGVRQFFDSVPFWDSRFNEIAASAAMHKALPLNDEFSRIKVWVWEKP